MGGLYLLLPALFVILVSFLMVRAAAIALMMTGMDQKGLSFQALSAFSGTGFTTKEAEFVMNHPVRRRIITWLMILGNAGIVTSKGYRLPTNVLILLIGLYVIKKSQLIRKLIRKWESFVENKLINPDYALNTENH